MEHFPVFLALGGRKVYLCGGESHLKKKAELLRSFGGEVVIFSRDSWEGETQVLRRDLTADDLAACPTLVVTAQSEGEDGRIAALCRERNIPVNAVDRPALCTFFFPALLQREHLCVAVGTGGAIPAAAVAVKEHIDANLTENFDEILLWAAKLREEVYRLQPQKELARRSIRQLLRTAMVLERPLTEEEVGKVLEEIQ